MGGSNSKEIVYAKPIPGTEQPGQTAVYRNAMNMNGLTVGYPGLDSLGDAWKKNI